jgi:hypothetical protein
VVEEVLATIIILLLKPVTQADRVVAAVVVEHHRLILGELHLVLHSLVQSDLHHQLVGVIMEELVDWDLVFLTLAAAAAGAPVVLVEIIQMVLVELVVLLFNSHQHLEIQFQQ